jgi:predicted flavoprotein YhiN
MEENFLSLKKKGSRKEIRTVLTELFSDRLGDALTAEFDVQTGALCERADTALREIAKRLHAWELFPIGTGGYGKAEVTRGGVSTAELSSKTMESRRVSGLFFIGEVVDVTGWLGGYNFQWAWASAAAAAEHV